MSQIDSEIPSQAMTSETNSDSSIGIKKGKYWIHIQQPIYKGIFFISISLIGY